MGIAVFDLSHHPVASGLSGKGMTGHVELDDLVRPGRIQRLAVQLDNIPTAIQVGESRFHTLFRLTGSKDTDAQRSKEKINVLIHFRPISFLTKPSIHYR